MESKRTMALSVVVVARPRLPLAPEALLAPVPPSATARSVIPVMEPPVIDTLLAAWVAIVHSPSVVRAAEASVSSTKLAQ